MERRRLLGNGTEDAETRTRVLSGVIALDFQYGSWDTNGKIRQEASWAIANELPVAIEFHLSVEQGDRERTFLVALRLSEP